jgi:beta-glucuronidase
MMREMIARDKNHPCVVMWSVANEAATYEKESLPYFEKVIAETRKLDSSRPITIAHCPIDDDCYVSQLADVICLNRYNSWYFDPGHLEAIEYQLERNLKSWHERFGKPIIVSEYGVDTIAGFHNDPPTMFSEEYQCRFLEHFHNIFDRLDFVIGEHVWNFADFATKQGIVRVSGNKKGIFTRQRQPKSAAFMLRKRWSGENAPK